MRLIWSEDFVTGVKDIDLQHQELFERISEFINACDQGRCKDEVDPILKFIEDYTRVHFDAEEKLQLEYAYPEYPAHKLSHEEFLKTFSKIKKRYEKEGPTNYLALLTYDFMIAWFLQHIASEDKALCQFLKAKNLALP